MFRERGLISHILLRTQVACRLPNNGHDTREEIKVQVANTFLCFIRMFENRL